MQTLPESATLSDALSLLARESFGWRAGVKHVPVTDANGCPVGMISFRDLIRTMLMLTPSK